ncbi:RICIN domain-containing protein [Kribbella catacumbae]|uniref:RICIN domain-containing protein n=1 Tax=Kribbella catacumbae TaxID=460086 RepID=UPI001ED99CBF|nr:RICIN domain-containing protein [Kribbella catacumbae]
MAAWWRVRASSSGLTVRPPNQQWKRAKLSDGFVTIESIRSGQVIDIPGSSTVEGTDVVQWPLTGNTNQQWKLLDVGSGRFKIVSRVTDKVLGIAAASTGQGATVEIQADTGHPSQHWMLSPV